MRTSLADQNAQEADRTLTALANTEDLVESLKKELGFMGMNLDEIQRRLRERSIACDETLEDRSALSMS